MGFWAKIFRIFLFFTLGFFLTVIYRTINAVLDPSITTDLGISHKHLSRATAVYFFSYSLMQLPVGFLVDRFGPRRVESILIAIGGIGGIVFAFADGPPLLIIGRFISGFGMAGGLMVGFVANRLWFSQKQVPILNSILSSIGYLGALVSSVPVYYVLQVISWRWVSIILAAINFLVAALIAIFVPDPPPKQHPLPWKNQLTEIKQIFSNSYFWTVAPLVFGIMGCFLNFQSFWISPYFQIADNTLPVTISYFLLTIGIGIMIGMPIAPLIHRFSATRISLNFIIGSGACASLIFQILIALNWLAPNFLFWFFYAFFSGFSMLSYAAITNYFPSKIAGKASTALNTLLFGTLFLMQFLFEFIVDIWGIYTSLGYFVAFWVFLCLEALCLIWFLLRIAKTRLKQAS